MLTYQHWNCRGGAHWDYAAEEGEQLGTYSALSHAQILDKLYCLYFKEVSYIFV